MRPAPTPERQRRHQEVEFVAASAVDIAQITPPTTAGANGADGAPDGGDPGVFIPGDTPTTTGPGATRGSGPARPGPARHPERPDRQRVPPDRLGRPSHRDDRRRAR